MGGAEIVFLGIRLRTTRVVGVPAFFRCDPSRARLLSQLSSHRLLVVVLHDVGFESQRQLCTASRLQREWQRARIVSPAVADPRRVAWSQTRALVAHRRLAKQNLSGALIPALAQLTALQAL